MMPSPNMSLPVHLAHHDVDTAQGDHRVRDVAAEAHVFKDSEMDKARRTHAVAVGVGRSIADEIKAELALRRFNAPIGLAWLGAQAAQFGLRIHDRTGWYAVDRLFQDFERLAHLEDSQHIAIVNVAMLAQRYAKIEAAVDAVIVHFANVVVYAGGAKHDAGGPGIDR